MFIKLLNKWLYSMIEILQYIIKKLNKVDNSIKTSIKFDVINIKFDANRNKYSILLHNKTDLKYIEFIKVLWNTLNNIKEWTSINKKVMMVAFYNPEDNKKFYILKNVAITKDTTALQYYEEVQKIYNKQNYTYIQVEFWIMPDTVGVSSLASPAVADAPLIKNKKENKYLWKIISFLVIWEIFTILLKKYTGINFNDLYLQKWFVVSILSISLIIQFLIVMNFVYSLYFCYKYKDKKYIIPSYYPRFVANFFQELNDINESKHKEIFVNVFIKSLFFFGTLFLIFIIISLFAMYNL